MAFKLTPFTTQPQQPQDPIQVGVDAEQAARLAKLYDSITHNQRLPGSNVEGASRVFTGFLSGVEKQRQSAKEAQQRAAQVRALQDMGATPAEIALAQAGDPRGIQAAMARAEDQRKYTRDRGDVIADRRYVEKRADFEHARGRKDKKEDLLLTWGRDDAKRQQDWAREDKKWARDANRSDFEYERGREDKKEDTADARQYDTYKYERERKDAQTRQDELYRRTRGDQLDDRKFNVSREDAIRKERRADQLFDRAAELDREDAVYARNRADQRADIKDERAYKEQREKDAIAIARENATQKYRRQIALELMKLDVKNAEAAKKRRERIEEIFIGKNLDRQTRGQIEAYKRYLETVEKDSAGNPNPNIPSFEEWSRTNGQDLTAPQVGDDGSVVQPEAVPQAVPQAAPPQVAPQQAAVTPPAQPPVAPPPAASQPTQPVAPAEAPQAAAAPGAIPPAPAGANTETWAKEYTKKAVTEFFDNKARRETVENQNRNVYDKLIPVLGNIQEMLGMAKPDEPGEWSMMPEGSVGGWGSFFRSIPIVKNFTDAGSQEKLYQNVKSFAFLGELKKMKQESPNGASGLGQVTAPEITALQNSIDAWDIDMEPELFLKKGAELAERLYVFKKKLEGRWTEEDEAWWNGRQQEVARTDRGEVVGAGTQSPQQVAPTTDTSAWKVRRK